MAFLKKDPRHPELGAFLGPHGVRPIGKTHSIQKVVSRPLMAEASARHGPQLSRLGQMGAGVSSGIEVVPRSLQMMFELHPHFTVWSKDVQNAFNSLSRQKIF